MSVMRGRWGWIAGCVVLAGLAFVIATAQAAEEGGDALPKAVADAISQAFPGAAIEKAGQESEDGLAVYEVELKYKGGELDVAVSPDGVIVAVGSEAGDIPEVVEAAVRDAVKGGKITEADKEEVRAVFIAELGQLCELKEPVVVYEIEYAKDGDEYEARVRADGKLLGIKEEEDDADDDGDDDNGDDGNDDEEDDD
jgi:uncharacterized membrane protein YkoI